MKLSTVSLLVLTLSFSSLFCPYDSRRVTQIEFDNIHNEYIRERNQNNFYKKAIALIGIGAGITLPSPTTENLGKTLIGLITANVIYQRSKKAFNFGEKPPENFLITDCSNFTPKNLKRQSLVGKGSDLAFAGGAGLILGLSIAATTK